MNQQSKLDIVDPKYQRTLIYGIQCMTTGGMYVGSTVQTLEERIEEHIRLRDCRAIQILDRGNYIPYEIQRWPCNTLREVLTLEGEWQRAYKACFPEHLVNKKIEGTFWNEHPEAKQAYDKQYRDEHREKIQVDTKKYRDEHKDESQARAKKPWTCEWCNKTMTTGGKYKHKKRCKLKPVVHEAQKGC
jgi:hypothetical protein